jgi:acyl-CoA dehydrogenase
MDDQELAALRATVRGLLDKHSGESQVRASMDSVDGVDRELWAMLADVGLLGLIVPEEYAGAGAGFEELGVVAEELGRALACVPFLSTIGLAVPVLLAAADDVASARWLPRIVEGDLIATAVLAPGTALRAVETDEGWQVSGALAHVVDGAVAEIVLVLAETSDGPTVLAVDLAPGAAGVERAVMRTSDLTRRTARLGLSSASASRVGAAGDGERIARAASAMATAVLSSEQVGGATAALDAAVAYAMTREQFGRPIGSFQAVKHRCADMLVSVETARSASWALNRALDARAETDLIASIARVVCSTSYCDVASGSIQVHGGVGYTWEHPAHLHLKRSRGSAVLLGTPEDHRRALADLVPVFDEAHVSSQPLQGAHP